MLTLVGFAVRAARADLDGRGLRPPAMTISKAGLPCLGAAAEDVGAATACSHWTTSGCRCSRSTRPDRPRRSGWSQARDGFIVVNECGRPMRPGGVVAAVADSVQEHRWRGRPAVLHAARHSTVTFMRNAGVPTR